MNSQLTLPIALNDKACFENFWEGRNQELVDALKQCVATTEYSSIYFYGVPSAGKSHLLFAVSKLAMQQNMPALYVSLSNSATTTELVRHLDAPSLVCIDDLDKWAGDTVAEQALFGLIEKVRQSNGQILMSALNPPQETGFVLPDLSSRVASGLVYSLHELDDMQRPLALKMRASHRGLSISDKAINFLSKRVPRDSSKLFAILDEIDRASLIEKRKITIPFLQHYLTEISSLMSTQ